MTLGLMALVNIFAIVQLTPTIVALTKDYRRKLAMGQSPEYNTGDTKVQGSAEPGVWK